MNILKIIDLAHNQIKISWQNENNTIQESQAMPFINPLTDTNINELNECFRQHSNFAELNNIRNIDSIDKKINHFGVTLFQQVFANDSPSSEAFSFFNEALNIGLDQCELCISSNHSDFLNIPWEFLKNSENDNAFLCQRFKGMYRLSEGKRVDIPFPPSNKPLRLLFVLSRPDNEKIINKEIRPVIEALQSLSKVLKIEVLRPSSWEAFQQQLQTRQYHFIHYDGLCLHDDSPDKKISLGFEKEDSSLDYISIEKLTRLLAECPISLFVLSTSQSNQDQENRLGSLVAGSLIDAGVKGVVTLPYSIMADSEATFMKQFYHAIIQGQSLSQAMSKGRHKLLEESNRDNIINKSPFSDSLIPVHYQQEDLFIPIPKGIHIEPDDNAENKRIPQPPVEEICPVGHHGFIGRDKDFLEIERKSNNDQRPWILLTGKNGLGKTELAFGFARWYKKTGGCPGGVFITSFKEKADFPQIVTSIVGYGSDFPQYSQEKQAEMLIHYLYKIPVLLIWDHFDAANDQTDNKESLASEEEKVKLANFLRALKGGKTRVIITSENHHEDWLNINYQHLDIKELDLNDSVRLVEHNLISSEGLKNLQPNSDFINLLTLLNGNPLSINLIAPLLKNNSPMQIHDALQQLMTKTNSNIDDSSISYVFSRLSSNAQKHLPLLGLFISYVSFEILSLFFERDWEGRKIVTDIMGHSLKIDELKNVLNEAVQHRLIYALTDNIYEIHSRLSQFFIEQLNNSISSENLLSLKTQFSHFYAYIANYFGNELAFLDSKTATMFKIEETNLLHALELAETYNNWANIQCISQTLNDYYNMNNRKDEWQVLRKRLLNSTDQAISKETTIEQANLWMFLLADKAESAFHDSRLKEAESDYRRILAYLRALNDPSNSDIAIIYLSLGKVAEDLQNFDQAQDLYSKAKNTWESLEMKSESSSAYHHLAKISKKLQQFDQAEELFNKAITINQDFNMKIQQAGNYNQLGILAYERKQLQKAEDFFSKALDSWKQMNLEIESANCLFFLGKVNLEQKNFEQANQYYSQASEIFEKHKLRSESAEVYYQLGNINWIRKLYSQAELWFQKALTLFGSLNKNLEMVHTLISLGKLTRNNKRYQDCVSWFGMALTISLKFKLDIAQQILLEIASLVKDMGEEQFITIYKKVFNNEPPMEPIRAIQKKAPKKKTKK